MLDLTPNELLRYSRHFSLPQVGLAGQKKLKNTSVLCVGAGGIGSPALLYLASAGIGKIGIVDNDTVELSNLQRQILYTTENCGQSKATLARQRLLAINDAIQVNAYGERLNSNNVLDMLSDYDIILDGSDNYATRYLVSDACYTKKKTLISASLFQFSGQLVTFQYERNNEPCYRCLYPNPPPVGLIQNCTEAGIVGAVAGILGTMAATQVIKHALSLSDGLDHQLLIFDGSTLEIKKYPVHKKENCIVCEKNTPFNDLPRYESNNCTVLNPLQLSPEQCLDLQQKKKVLLIDVREAWEREIYAIPNSTHIPTKQLETLDLNTLASAENETIVLYCKSGIRSERSAKFLQQRGIENVYNLAGGVVAWAAVIDKKTVIY